MILIITFLSETDFFYITYSFTGTVKPNVAPLPSLLFSPQISPSCAFTILLEIYNPNPVPWKDIDANFVNNLGTKS